MDKIVIEREILKMICSSNKAVSMSNLKKNKTLKGVSLHKINIVINNLLKKSIIRKGHEGLFLDNKNIKLAVTTKVCSTFGFVKTIDTNEEILIPGRYMIGMLPGDKVLVEQFRGRGESNLEGRVLFIKSMSKAVYYGRIIDMYGEPVFSSYEINFPLEVEAIDNSYIGKLVLAKVVHRGLDVDEHVAKITKVIGSETDPNSCCELILHQRGIDRNFNSEILKQAVSMLKYAIPDCEYKKRLDLRDEVIFTIDGADSKDLDDAVSVDKLNDGSFRLGVHIADVSYYVRGGSDLDKEAFKRGTSIYYADKVIPMLPKELSNGICSLNPNEDRLTFSVIINLDKEGNMISYDFKKTIIRSRVKGVYSEINQLINGEATDEIKSKYKDVQNHISLMMELAKLFQAKRQERGSLNIETQECKIKIKDDKVEIAPLVRGESENIIEEFMLKANEAAAMFAQKNKIPFIYRVHENPPVEKFKMLQGVLNNLNVSIPKSNSQLEISKIIDSVAGTKLQFVVNNIILRSMAKARYSAEYLPHYGLALNDYAHFTSPIRRYPDLMIHRIMSQCIIDNSRECNRCFVGVVDKVAVQSSVCEKNSDNVERECEGIYKAYYMSNFIGEKFTGVVSSVTQYGFYVQLPNCVEGLVHKNTLPNGEYEMINMIEIKNLKDNKFSVKIGDTVEVKLLKTDVFSGQIDFKMEV